MKKKLIFFISLTVAIDLIVQHIRDFLSNRLDSLVALSPTSTPNLNGAIGSRGKTVCFNGDRPH